MKGVPLTVIAAQLGHADVRMVEKHYGHLAPNYIADTVRAAFGSMGLRRWPAESSQRQASSQGEGVKGVHLVGAVIPTL